MWRIHSPETCAFAQIARRYFCAKLGPALAPPEPCQIEHEIPSLSGPPQRRGWLRILSGVARNPVLCRVVRRWRDRGTVCEAELSEATLQARIAGVPSSERSR